MGNEAGADAVPRVLQVVGSLDRGGAETMLMNVYRALDKARLQFDFLVFTTEQGAYEAEVAALGGRILRLPRPGTVGYRSTVRGIQQVILTHGPYRAVHAHVNLASSVALQAAKRAAVQVRVAHSHSTADPAGGWRRASYRALAREAIGRSATDVVACGQDAGRFLFGRRWSRSGIVLPNSVDVERFLSASPPARNVDSCDGESLGLVLGAVARMDRVKNHAFMLEITRRCIAKGMDVRLRLVGDGPLRGELEAQTSKYGLSDRVDFLGVRDDVPEQLKAIDLLLMPSQHEGMPVVLVEAQAAGTPSLVSSRVTTEVDLGLGLVSYIDIDDPERWVDAVEKFERPRTGRADILERLRSRGYDVKQAVQEIYTLYGVDR